MNKIIRILTGTVLTPASLLILTGCWTPPNANVQPAGEPRLIQSGLKVESVKEPATVKAVDTGAQTLTLELADHTTATYRIGALLKYNLTRLQPGNQVSVTVTEELDVYLLANGKLPDGTTAEKLGVNAKLTFNDSNADASYRLLTLVYPSGQKETVKVGLDAKVSEMADGDSVVVRPLEVTKISIE